MGVIFSVLIYLFQIQIRLKQLLFILFTFSVTFNNRYIVFGVIFSSLNETQAYFPVTTLLSSVELHELAAGCESVLTLSEEMPKAIAKLLHNLLQGSCETIAAVAEVVLQTCCKTVAHVSQRCR